MKRARPPAIRLVREVVLASYDPATFTWTYHLDCGHLETRKALVARRWHAVEQRLPCSTCGRGEA